MKGKKVLVMIIYMVVLGIAPFSFIWIEHGGMTLEWALGTVAFLLLTVASMVFFLARVLEKHGYSKKDIKRLHVILEEHWEEPWEWGYLKYDVQRYIAYHIVFWGFLSTALLELRDVSLVIVGFIGVIFVLVTFYPILATMIVWFLCLPLYLLKNEKAKGMFEFVGRSSLVSTFGILGVWAASSYFTTRNYPEQVLNMFRGVVSNAGGLLVLSALNALFGVLGIYFPRRFDRKIVTMVLLTLAIFALLVVWDILTQTRVLRL
ncbi:hypothetical protein E3E26_03845 [Thermococcus sp. LS1]|nr:hypothetical protein [Thermococcus sp. LS1]